VFSKGSCGTVSFASISTQALVMTVLLLLLHRSFLAFATGKGLHLLAVCCMCSSVPAEHLKSSVRYPLRLICLNRTLTPCVQNGQAWMCSWSGGMNLTKFSVTLSLHSDAYPIWVLQMTTTSFVCGIPASGGHDAVSVALTRTMTGNAGSWHTQKGAVASYTSQQVMIIMTDDN
jgi:hypothetical protein